MRLDAAIEVHAPADLVFDVYRDVEAWPQWTPTVTRLDLLEPGPLRVGSKARIRQPRLPVAVWQVTELTPGRSFTWVARGPGITTTATHTVTSVTAVSSHVAASLDQSGMLGPLMYLATRRLTMQYLGLELRSLKSRCEA